MPKLSPMVIRFKVQSCADGSMRVIPTYRKAYKQPGLLSRLYLAKRIEDRLNGKKLT